jgi:hypothetical protein
VTAFVFDSIAAAFTLSCHGMQKRGARLAVVALLLVIGGAAAVLSRDIDRQLRTLDDVERDVAQRLDGMTASLVDIGLAQNGYVALGGTDTPPQVMVESLIRRFEQDVSELGDRAMSPDASGILQAVTGEMAQVATIDARAQDYARGGQTFLASDLLFGAARQHLIAAATHLQALRAAEAAAVDAQRTAMRQDLWSGAGVTSAIGIAGILLLGLGGASRPSRGPEPVAQPAPGPSVADAAPDHAAEQPAAEAARARAVLDLTAAAVLCSDLSRVETAAALPDLLARAAGIIDARGLIVWMGAGEQLFAAAAHGYDVRIVSRLAPIERTATNATATAWRTGRPGTVIGGHGSHGAIVAPMFNPTRCIGVLAAEVRHGREHDAAARAITGMIAAQLGSVLAAWPAASNGGGSDAALDRAAG